MIENTNDYNINHFIKKLTKHNKDRISFIKQISDSVICMGTFRGFTFINTNKIKSKNENFVGCYNISFTNNNSTKSTTLNNDSTLYFPYNCLNIELTCEREHLPLKYQYRLVSKKENQLVEYPWTEELILKTENLSKGDYYFTVQSKDCCGNIKEQPIGKFTIEKDGLISKWLKYLILIIIIFFLFYGIIRLRKLKRKKLLF